MAENWNKLDQSETPELATITAFVANPLWQRFLDDMAAAHQPRLTVEYSGCGMMPGWNVKLKKGGRGLCTLYPRQGGFTVLVVIGQREKAEAELALPTFTPYTQALYHRTKEGMGQRWLMFEVADEGVLEDVKRCIGMRRHR